MARGKARPKADAVAIASQGRVTSTQYYNAMSKPLRLKRRV